MILIIKITINSAITNETTATNRLKIPNEVYTGGNTKEQNM